MGNTATDYLLWLVCVVVSAYTLSYAWWLFKKRERRGAVGVALLAFITALYPGIVIFFINQ